MSRWQTKTIITILSLLLILLGFAIRLHNLGRDSMWWDEIATIQIARGGLETAVQATLIL